jgi:hypothetical protein
MAFMGGSRLALLREARQQAEGNMDRAERGGQGLRQAILDYGSETRAYQDLGIRKDQNQRAAERFAMQKQALEEAAAAAAEEERRKAASGALESKFALKQQEDERWRFRPEHPDGQLPRAQRRGTDIDELLLDESKIGQAAEAPDVSAQGGVPSAESVSLPVGGGASHDMGGEDFGKLSPYFEHKPVFDKPLDEYGPRDVMRMARELQAEMAASGHQMELGEIVRRVAERDAKLSKEEFSHEDHLADDERKRLVREQKEGIILIDQAKLESRVKNLARDENMEAALNAKLPRFEAALRGRGDEEMNEVVRVMRRQLGVDPSQENYEAEMKSEFANRFDNFQRSVKVSGNSAVNKYLMMKLKQGEDRAKRPPWIKGTGISNNQLDDMTKGVNTVARMDDLMNQLMIAGDNTGFLKSIAEDASKYGNLQSMTFSELRAKHRGILADYIKSISGAAATDKEREDLMEVLLAPNVREDLLIKRWGAFRDRIAEDLDTQIESFDAAHKIDRKGRTPGEKGFDEAVIMRRVGRPLRERYGSKTASKYMVRKIAKKKGFPVKMVRLRDQSVLVAENMQEVDALLDSGYEYLGDDLAPEGAVEGAFTGVGNNEPGAN